jgi:hypothetical protein
MQLTHELLSIDKHDSFAYPNDHPGTQIGQNLVLGTLAESNVSLMELELTTKMNGPHCFRLHATMEVVEKACRTVEVLILGDEFGDFKFDDNLGQALSTVPITKNTFPALRKLVLDA